eukprot:917804-Heterocapsa_arctica.AAC.1
MGNNKEGGTAAPRPDWKESMAPGSTWSWHGPRGQGEGSWNSTNQQPPQEDQPDRRPVPGVEAPEGQPEQQSDPSDPRRTGGPMEQQPKRNGSMPPEDQERPTGAYARPGQYD